MAIEILQRPMWHGEPVKQADFIRPHKPIAGRERAATGELWSHQFGWELRLIVDRDFQRSQVCRSQEEVFNTSDAWKAALVEKGWA